MHRKDMPLGEIEEVKKVCGEADVNKYLKEGWILLDAKVIQYVPESLEKAVGYYIIGS